MFLIPSRDFKLSACSDNMLHLSLPLRRLIQSVIRLLNYYFIPSHIFSIVARHQWWRLPDALCCIRPARPAANGTKVCQMELPKCKAFIATCETVIAKGHWRGKCFSTKRWQRIVEIFNKLVEKNWTTSQMKNCWSKLRKQHKHLFELLRWIGIDYRSGTGTIVTTEHWWEAKIKAPYVSILL